MASAAPAAHAKLYDPNAVSSASRRARDLRSPDTREVANGYMPAREQDLRAPDQRDAAREFILAGAQQDLRMPDTRDAATAHPASPAIRGGDGTDATTWALLAFAVVASCVTLGAVARSRRMRVRA